MSTPDSPKLSRVCDLLLREAFLQSMSTLHLEPKGEGYVVMAVRQGRSEEVLAPPVAASLGLFVYLCQRANVAADVCQGSFGFSHEGRERKVDLRVSGSPQGKRATLQLAEAVDLA